MKRIISLILICAIFATFLCACGNRGLYYNYDMSKYMSVGKYSAQVDTSSDSYKEAEKTFYTQTFGETLAYKAEEGIIEKGDVANINYVGLKDDVAFEGGTASNYDLKIGSGTFIPGLEEGLIGAKIGENVSLNLTFPESYQSEELAGQKVVFNVTVNYATKYADPTEEDAKKYGYDSLKAYETEQHKFAVESVMYLNVYEAATFKDFPQKELEYLTQQVISLYESEYAKQGATLEQVASAYGYTLDEFKEALKEVEVIPEMKYSMVAYYILQQNGEKLTKQDVENKRAALDEQYDASLESLGFYDIVIQSNAAYDKAAEILSKEAVIK